MSFRSVPKSVILNDPEQHNGPYFALNSVASGAHCIKAVKDIPND